VELRSKFLPFRILKHHFNLGAVVFTDVGRAWADYKVRRDLDGENPAGLGLKAGVGGGLRLQWGEAFLIRADVAWSHVDDNLGIYIDASHVF
jgi:outer membrane translocation and assembly module TamA